MGDLANLIASVIALGAPLVSGPVGIVESRPALALHEVGGSDEVEVLYADGEKAGVLPATRYTVSYQDLPELYYDALIATEDSGFRSHQGIAPAGLARAVGSYLLGNGGVGGSSITQQLAKNVVTGNERSISRKVAETISAVQTEAVASKEEILESYANAVYFGRGSHGARYAAQNWFGKEWPELSLSEISFLAGVVQAPSALDPRTDEDRARVRRDYVLERLHAENVISDAELRAALSEPLKAEGAHLSHGVADVTSDADFWAMSLARRSAGRKSVGEEFRLTLDSSVQQIVQDALLQGLSGIRSAVPDSPFGTVLADDGSLPDPASLPHELHEIVPIVPDGARHVYVDHAGRLRTEDGDRIDTSLPTGAQPGDVYVLLPEDSQLSGRPSIQGAVVVVDQLSGNIIASVGGTHSWASQFDRTRARRQPGSAIKPFLYLAALEAGYSPMQQVTNAPVVFTDSAQVWSPDNYGRQSRGTLPLFQALETSLNQVAARIAGDIGLHSFQAILEEAGAYPAGTERLLLPSAVLGTVETSPADMARAVSALDWRHGGISGGWYLKALERMMKGIVTRGTAARAFSGGPDGVVGKTGTSQDHRDAWFIGRTGDIALAVWVGRDDNRPMPAVHGRNATGGSLAAPIAADIIEKLRESGLSRVRITTEPFGHRAARSISTELSPALNAFPGNRDLRQRPPDNPLSSAGRSRINPLPGVILNGRHPGSQPERHVPTSRVAPRRLLEAEGLF